MSKALLVNDPVGDEIGEPLLNTIYVIGRERDAIPFEFTIVDGVESAINELQKNHNEYDFIISGQFKGGG